MNEIRVFYELLRWYLLPLRQCGFFFKLNQHDVIAKNNLLILTYINKPNFLIIGKNNFVTEESVK